ncbi:sugar phosphate isomerase/epimerase family protein [Gemmata obscuriglobus]|nr:sugar phosphate isomerase/epimerase [Gemmata obscuriglobus]
MARRPVALQLWTVRDAFAADADRALAAVKAAGFSAVELARLPPGLALASLAESLDRHGLAVTSIHGDLLTSETIDYWASLARACRCSKVIWHGWPRDPRFDSLNGVKDLIGACNAAATVAGDHGLKFGVHNHWWEFEPLDGDRPIRLLHEGLHPDVFWQIDVYWAQTAGSDPAAVVTELGPRVRSLHWKDGPCVHGQPMVALGEGQVDVPRTLRALSQPTDWVIELDECATDPLQAAARSRVYLESLAGSEPQGCARIGVG